MLEYNQLNNVHALTNGDITDIGMACGNGWRKVFNVYSKLLYALDPACFSDQRLAPTWQAYRDSFLLHNGSGTALLFSPPLLNQCNKCIHIISGKTYAKELINNDEISTSLVWLDEHFAIDSENRVIVCPYFDYRQLSNLKIERLAQLIEMFN
jgi:hypothetical protein